MTKEKDLTKERNEKCIPIAKEVLGLISKYDGPIGDIKNEDIVEDYEDLEVEILKLYLKNKLTASEVTYIQQLVLQAVDVPLNFVKQSIFESWDRAMEVKFGKPEEEVTLEDLDKILQ